MLVETDAIHGESGDMRRHCTNVGVSHILARFHSFYFRFSNYFVPISHQCRQKADGEDERVDEGDEWGEWRQAKDNKQARG